MGKRPQPEQQCVAEKVHLRTCQPRSAQASKIPLMLRTSLGPWTWTWAGLVCVEYCSGLFINFVEHCIANGLLRPFCRTLQWTPSFLKLIYDLSGSGIQIIIMHSDQTMEFVFKITVYLTTKETSILTPIGTVKVQAKWPLWKNVSKH